MNNEQRPFQEPSDAMAEPLDEGIEATHHIPSPDLLTEEDPLIGHIKPDVVPLDEAGIANDYNVDIDDGSVSGPDGSSNKP